MYSMLPFTNFQPPAIVSLTIRLCDKKPEFKQWILSNLQQLSFYKSVQNHEN